MLVRDMDQQRVATFLRDHDLESPPAYRLLDLVSEVGELSKDAAVSTGYGESPADLAINSDEIGDVLFSVLALAEGLDVDAEAALDEALEKYETRLADGDGPGSGH